MSYKTTSRRAIPPMISPQWSMADRSMAHYRACLRELFADLPIVAKGVGHAARSPTVLFVHRRDHSGSRGDRLLEHRFWIVDREDHPNRLSAPAPRAGVDVLLDPENRTLDRELRDSNAFAIAVESVQLDRAERLPVEIHRARCIADGQPRRDPGTHRHSIILISCLDASPA